MNIKAFIDHGFQNERTFCINLLRSSEFLSTTIKKFSNFGNTKEEMSVNVAEELEKGKVDQTELLLAFVKQPRQWLSYKLGGYGNIPALNNPATLLYEFGDETWYGPIYCDEQEVNYFIRTYKFPFYTVDGDKKVITNNVRWSIIAKVANSNISVYWNGFSTNQQDRINSYSQFAFWHYIPEAFKELEENLEGTYDNPLVHKLVLKDMWERYVSNPDYSWQHLAVRAEASGVNLCARSKALSEIDIGGLLALAQKISTTMIEDIFPNMDDKKKNYITKKAENSVLKTLILEWGTKSYEFSLDKENKRLFKAHCYFGLKPHSQTQDCFPHFKCYQMYGGPSDALEFLLDEAILEL